MSKTRPTLFTIGHSTRSLEEFVAILKAHDIGILADVRTVPRSRHVPQFNAQSLGPTLARHKIDYVLLPSLGGLRKTSPDSVNLAWRNASFRGYADYMQTPEFGAGLEELMHLASKKPTAIMCAEAVPWRCHRSLIADALTVRGWQVMDLMSEHSAKPHTLTSFAQVKGKKVTYPAAAAVPRARKECSSNSLSTR